MRNKIVGAILALLTVVGGIAATEGVASASTWPYGYQVTVNSSFPGTSCYVTETAFSAGGGATLGFKFQTTPIAGTHECYTGVYYYNGQAWAATQWFVQLNYLQVNNFTGAATVVSMPLKDVYFDNYTWQEYGAFTNTWNFHWASPNLRLWRCTAPGLYSNPPASTTNCVIDTEFFN